MARDEHFVGFFHLSTKGKFVGFSSICRQKSTKFFFGSFNDFLAYIRVIIISPTSNMNKSYQWGDKNKSYYLIWISPTSNMPKSYYFGETKLSPTSNMPKSYQFELTIISPTVRFWHIGEIKLSPISNMNKSYHFEQTKIRPTI